MLIRARQAGVSIIEALIVVALIVILVLLALPMGLEWMANSRRRTEAESMLAGMQLARAEAVRRNARVEFFLNEDDACRVNVDVDGDGVAEEDEYVDVDVVWGVRPVGEDECIRFRSADEWASDVVLTPTPNTATTVTFDGLGRQRPTNADGSDPIEQIDISLPAGNARDLRLQIGVGGQVLLCDPNVEDTDVRRCPS